MKVEVVPHSPNWRSQFIEEAKQVAEALGENIVTIHHIGSTAIPHIYAKPVIDLLVEVQDIIKVDAQNSSMALLGYEAMGEYGIPGRRYFRKQDATGKRTYNMHTFEVGSSEIERHLAFRDYMIAHPQDAQKYGELKYALAQQYPDDIEAYMDGKDAFVKEMDRKAAAWRIAQTL